MARDWISMTGELKPDAKKGRLSSRVRNCRDILILTQGSWVMKWGTFVSTWLSFKAIWSKTCYALAEGSTETPFRCPCRIFVACGARKCGLPLQCMNWTVSWLKLGVRRGAVEKNSFWHILPVHVPSDARHGSRLCQQAERLFMAGGEELGGSHHWHLAVLYSIINTASELQSGIQESAVSSHGVHPAPAPLPVASQAARLAGTNDLCVLMDRGFAKVPMRLWYNDQKWK